MQTVTVVMIRPTFYRAQRIEAGDAVDVLPLEAGELLGVRAVLKNDADAARVREAVQAQARRAVKTPSPLERTEPESPWRRLG